MYIYHQKKSWKSFINVLYLVGTVNLGFGIFAFLCGYGIPGIVMMLLGLALIAGGICLFRWYRKNKRVRVDELIYHLIWQYGSDFNWMRIPSSNESFVAELRRELGEKHFLYNQKIHALAKCKTNDDVLFVSDDDGTNDIYYIFHLTYSQNTENNSLKCKKFVGINAVKEYLELSYNDLQQEDAVQEKKNNVKIIGGE